MRVDDKGWLLGIASDDPAVVRWNTPRTTTLESTTPLARQPPTTPPLPPTPLGIVWHWTAGRCGKGFAEGCCKEINTYDPKKDRAASWHILIAKDGTVHQCASFLRGTWHVGRAGTIGTLKSVNINRCTVGVELENAGRLIKLGQKAYCWPYWLNPDALATAHQPDPRYEVDINRARPGAGGFWKDAEGGNFDVFPPAQIASATKLLAALVAAYGWDPAVCGYGHVMFDWPRKEDPGPLWLLDAMPGILDAVFPARVCKPPG